MKTNRILIMAVALVAILSLELDAEQASAGLSLEYDSPAGTWNEALPIGNGRLGAMVYCAPGMERLQLNEDTLWAGGPNYALEPRMKDAIPKIRERVLAGDSDGALEEFRAKRLKTSKNGNSFAYQTIGSLGLKFAGHDFPTRYRRSLSLEDAVVRTEYDVGGVTFTREAFASLVDDVIVVRLRASRPGAISFTAFFESPWQRFAENPWGRTLRNLERIPSRYGTGYMAKMKRRETRTAEECAHLDFRLRGMPHKMMVIHCEAILDAMFKMAAETGCICRLGDYLAIDPHVRGHFDEPTGRFDPRKGHSVSFTIKPAAS